MNTTTSHAENQVILNTLPPDPETVAKALSCGEPGCSCGRQAGGGYKTHCPAHNDPNPSLSVSESNGKLLVKCFGGCSQEAVIEALKQRNLWPSQKSGGSAPGKGRNGSTVAKKSNKTGKLTVAPPAQHSHKSDATPGGLTLAELGMAKKVPPEKLVAWGVADFKGRGKSHVNIPYMSTDGETVAIRRRHTLNGAQRFSWRKGDRVSLYGLWRIKEIREAGWCLLVEGETDCWTCWLYDLPALGIPGKSTWRPEWAELLQGVEVYLWQEPDAQELPGKVANDIPDLKVISAPDGVKDLNEALCQGQDVAPLVTRLKAQAIPASQLIQEEKNSRIEELKTIAAHVLAAPDPLELVESQIRALGCGGDLKPALIVYLAMTSRLLEMRQGTMPVHLLLLAQASAGKSYLLGLNLLLFPLEAYHTIPAGSPRVLIYDDADLKHRVAIFGEADSLPAGEDNPAASAIRNLLQDHFLHYEVTVQNPDTREYTTKKISKPGPTVLITTSTRRLGHQLDTRLFSLGVCDSPQKIKEALMTQADLELNGAPKPEAGLIAFQAYLQSLAPWKVVIPFVRELAEKIGERATAPRVMRDFARLQSLIKSVAVIRHQHRQRDNQGRIIATIDDYEAVCDLVGAMYETTSTGASSELRDTVKAIMDMLAQGKSPTATSLANRLGIDRSTASRRVKTAIKHGWVVNKETKKGYPWDLEIGEPLPEKEGLPHPEQLTAVFCGGVSDCCTDNTTPEPIEKITVADGCCRVAEVTDDASPSSLKEVTIR